MEFSKKQCAEKELDSIEALNLETAYVTTGVLSARDIATRYASAAVDAPRNTNNTTENGMCMGVLFQRGIVMM